MLRINKLTDYAIVLLAYMAKEEQPLYTTADITANTHLSKPTVSKLLKILAKANLIASKRGSHGGYSLKISPQMMTLQQIIAAIEGKTGLTECSQSISQCVVESNCMIRHNWRTINEYFAQTLSLISLADMTKTLHLPTPRV